MSFLTIWLYWKLKIIKIVASSAAENMGKKGLSIAKRSKFVTLHEEGYSERPLFRELKFSKTAVDQAVNRFKTFGSFQDLIRAGRPKVTSQRYDHMMQKMVARLPL